MGLACTMVIQPKTKKKKQSASNKQPAINCTGESLVSPTACVFQGLIHQRKKRFLIGQSMIYQLVFQAGLFKFAVTCCGSGLLGCQKDKKTGLESLVDTEFTRQVSFTRIR